MRTALRAAGPGDAGARRSDVGVYLHTEMPACTYTHTHAREYNDAQTQIIRTRALLIHAYAKNASAQGIPLTVHTTRHAAGTVGLRNQPRFKVMKT